MTVNASSGGETARPVEYAYVVGVPIPDSEITSRLLTLYRGVTRNLLTGIAMKESSYRQFSDRTLFGYAGKWPLESYDGGSHIGLMMVPITMADSWNCRRIPVLELEFLMIKYKLQRDLSGVSGRTITACAP